MGKIAYGRNVGQACTTLKGMQIPLQQPKDIQVSGIFAPALQRFGGAVDEVAGLFQEDLRKLFVHVIIGFGHFRQRRLFGRRWFFICRYFGFIHLKAEIDFLEFTGEFLLEGVGFLVFCARGPFQVFERGNHVVAGFRGKPGSHLIHHVDQLFVSCPNGLEKGFVRRFIVSGGFVVGVFQRA